LLSRFFRKKARKKLSVSKLLRNFVLSSFFVSIANKKLACPFWGAFFQKAQRPVAHQRPGVQISSPANEMSRGGTRTSFLEASPAFFL